MAHALGLGQGSGFGFAGGDGCFALTEWEQFRAGGRQLSAEETCQLASAAGFFFFLSFSLIVFLILVDGFEPRPCNQSMFVG